MFLLLFISILTWSNHSRYWLISVVFLYSIPLIYHSYGSESYFPKKSHLRSEFEIIKQEHLGKRKWRVIARNNEHYFVLKGKMNQNSPPETGVRIKLEGSFNRFGLNANNYERSRINQGFVGSVFVTQWNTVAKERLSVFEKVLKLRSRLQNRLISIPEFEKGSLSVVMAISFGDRALLSTKTKQLFLESGLYHYLAISGLHVGIVYLILGGTIVLLPIQSRLIKFFLIVFALLVYGWIAGMQVSVVRAIIMFIFIHYSRLYGKSGTFLNITLFSALLQLIINPNLLFDLGFQLSYTAVIGIVLGYPFLFRLLRINQINFWLQKPIQLLIVSFVAFLFTYPILQYHIGVVYPAGIVLGLIFTSMFFVITGLCFINLFALLLGGISYLSQVMNWIVLRLLALLEYCSDFYLGIIDDFSLPEVLLWLFALLLIVTSRKAKNWCFIVGMLLFISINF